MHAPGSVLNVMFQLSVCFACNVCGALICPVHERFQYMLSVSLKI